MPILNRDILHEILIESLDMASTRPLANFMMAGKETMRIALNYFGQAKSIKAERKYADICLPGPHGNVDHYQISYFFPLLKLILAAAELSIEELDICNASPKTHQRNVFDNLIVKDLKKVSLPVSRNPKFPERYNNLLKQSQIENFSVKLVGSLDQLTMIPDSCRRLHFRGVYINDFLVRNRRIFPSVKELVIDDGKMLNLNIQKHKKFALFISAVFPALESLYLNYELKKRSNWNSIKNWFLRFQPNVFYCLSPNVKGCIHIKKKLFGNFETAIRDTHGKPNITVDRETKCIEKKFQIHDGLLFVSSFSFH